MDTFYLDVHILLAIAVTCCDRLLVLVRLFRGAQLSCSFVFLVFGVHPFLLGFFRCYRVAWFASPLETGATRS